MLSDAIIKDKFNAELYFKRGMLYFKISHPDNAVEDLDSSMKLNPVKFGKDPVIANLIGDVFKDDHKQYIKAIPYYSIAIKYAPDWPEYYFNRGVCYDMSDQDEFALKDYNKAIELGTNIYSAYNNKAWILYEKGYKDEACKLFDLAIMKGSEKAIENKKKYCK